MENHIQFKNTPHQFSMIAIEGNMDGEPFEMGGESGYDDSKPIHKVKLSDYWLGEYPVTQALWEVVMGSNPSNFKGANRPVERVAWNDIVHDFLPKLNKMTEGVRPTGTEYRLPTEAQWEYGAIGGKYWAKHTFEYSGSDKLDEVGWYSENSHGETKPVGLKTPNLLGLYDMSGNVWEWCEDWFDSDYYKNCQQRGIVENPYNRTEGSGRVQRGGSWFSHAEDCRPADRFYDTPTFRFFNIGFRLALFFSSV
ncbi:MAG: formylglycine-generating enzyme family protein [Saprospiraceae bacterium]|nr:formylglycine-generating enzyme family protein [Saprospiraceae bacterium]